MPVDLIVRNGNVVTPRDVTRAAVAIDKGRVVAIGDESILPPGRKTIDVKGNHILPGVIDPHFHPWTIERYPYECRTETRAAAAGGVTTLGIFLITRREDGPLKGIEEGKRVFEENGIVDAFFHVFARPGDQLGFSQMPDCPSLGVTSFKVSAAEATVDDVSRFTIFEQIAKMGGINRAMVHCENWDLAAVLRERLIKAGRMDFPAWNDSRPNFVEAESMMRNIYFSKITGCPIYIVHITIKEGVDILAQGKADGVDVIGETCAQYLTHTSQDRGLLADNPPLGRVNPPLRARADNDRLWQGIKDGIIDTMGSDHIGYTLKDKEGIMWDAPRGLGNLTEMQLPVLISEGVNKGRITLPKVVEVACQNPAMTFGLYPRKGALNVGSDADLVVVDLNKKVNVSWKMLHSLSDWSIWEGWEFKGWPVLTMRRGEVIVEDGKILASDGSGKYIPSPYL
ncbi:MAG: amidohydrolase family protein [Chloroflexi bacterium]|nr:amidohydrolase family protein [Chloroflexota bacterium]